MNKDPASASPVPSARRRHEAGHSLVAQLTPEHSDQVHKVTIIPRGMALGITQTLPVEDRLSLTKEQIGNTIIASVAITIIARLIIGWLCDRIGPRLSYAFLLLFGSIPGMAITPDGTGADRLRICPSWRRRSEAAWARGRP